VVAFRPEDVGSKEARVSAISPYVEAGNVYLPEDASWLGDYIEQTAAFPRGKHDDDVDMTSQAVLRLFGLGGITEKDVIRVPRKPHVPKGSLYGGGM
jgi:phage terminase large subunit-like protein